MTKEAIRQKVWNRIVAAGVAKFPDPHGRVPNFIGADRAAALLSKLTIWKRAKVLVVDNSAPQFALRRLAMTQGKILYLAVPGLRSDHCFIELDPARLGSRGWRITSLRAAIRFGRPVSPHEMRPIDLILTGSVAVTRQGARVGRGLGAMDLEYGVLRQAGKIREYTPIITTVHPVQIVEERIPMRAHDIPIDFMITPDQVVAVPSLYPRPRGVLWELLAEEKVRAIPVLRKGRRNGPTTARPQHV